MNRNTSILLKTVITTVIALLLLIPTSLMQGIISERQQRKTEVVNEIATKWASKQLMAGPFLKIPYYKQQKTWVKTNNQNREEIRKVLDHLYLSPAILKVQSELIPDKRKRGIFEVLVYQAKSKIDVTFHDYQRHFEGISPDDILYEKAQIVFYIQDKRGLNSGFKINNVIVDSLLKASISNNTSLHLISIKQAIKANAKADFHLEFTTKGSEQFKYIPAGKQFNMSISSKWKTPSFDGRYLPDSVVIDQNGFKANWQMTELNASLPISWNEKETPNFNMGDMGVKLINPLDNYQRSERSVKYAILIISLSFLAFFLADILKKQPIHAIQYFLIGAALCLFFLLLIALSEVLMFNLAYLLSTTGIILLIHLYSRTIFKQTGTAWLLTALSILLYVFVFVIIQLEDTALLVGSIGLFLILGLTMYATRNVQWFENKNMPDE